MPRLTHEQIAEIELEFQDLFEEVEKLRIENEALRARLVHYETYRAEGHAIPAD